MEKNADTARIKAAPRAHFARLRLYHRAGMDPLQIGVPNAASLGTSRERVISRRDLSEMWAALRDTEASDALGLNGAVKPRPQLEEKRRPTWSLNLQ
jgi:hypothetical protein